MRNFKGWLIVALVVIGVMLVGAGGATAASLITSKNIKNGTIKMEDISSSAKRALKGNTGTQGAQGVQGPAGGFDPAKVTYVEGSMVTAYSGEAAVSTAYCPAGMKAIGGGYFFAYANDGLTVEMSQPLADGSGWLAGFANTGSIAGDATAYAVCAAK